MLHHSNGVPFATGRTSYSDHFDQAKGDSDNRIWIPVRFAKLPRGMAIVDTGAPWCVLSKGEAEFHNSNYKGDALMPTSLYIRGYSTQGVLVRWPVTLCAVEGDELEIESTIFIPDEDIAVPNFIGLKGLLSRINFAVDSQKQHFFFGVES